MAPPDCATQKCEAQTAELSESGGRPAGTDLDEGSMGCHGDSGQGTPLGPALTGKKWLWSDGSYAGIKKTITEGVPQPKEFRSPMPPMGGAQLTPDQVPIEPNSSLRRVR